MNLKHIMLYERGKTKKTIYSIYLTFGKKKKKKKKQNYRDRHQISGHGGLELVKGRLQRGMKEIGVIIT